MKREREVKVVTSASFGQHIIYTSTPLIPLLFYITFVQKSSSFPFIFLKII